MINIKTPEEIKVMQSAGKIAAEVLQEVLKSIKPGITTMDLEHIANAEILKRGATPSFKQVEGYKYATCININEGLVHGLPGAYVIKRGDLVSVDMGAFYNGFHSDLSYTVEVETNNYSKFLEAGKKALDNGIFNCIPGNHIGDISAAMQKTIESHGYSVSRDLVGHGIGRELHEDPYVPGYGKPGKGAKIEPGMVFAIEIIYQTGSPEIAIDSDDWTIKTRDGSMGGLFEHTVAVVENGFQILTL